MILDQLETMSRNDVVTYTSLYEYYAQATRKLARKPPKYLTDSEKWICQVIMDLCFFSDEKRNERGLTFISYNLVEAKTGKGSTRNRIKTAIDKVMKRGLFIYEEEKRTRGKGLWVLVP